MQPEQWESLKEEIQAKCVTYDYVDAGDTTLATFITNLLRYGKSADEINDELKQLVGSDYDVNLTRWLFDMYEKYNNPGSENPSQSNATPQRSPDTTKPERSSRIFAQAIDGVGRHSNPSHRTRRVSRSRSRSPETRSRDHTSYRKRSPSSGITTADESPKRQVTILQNAGQSRPSVFSRLGSTRPAVIKETTQERCKFWPSCNNGDNCPFFHPKTICPDFPRCPKPASECRFIHPESAQTRPVQMPIQMTNQIPVAQPVMKRPFPCKFYPYCANPVCPFIHPGEMMGMPPMPPRGPIPCQFGDKCTRPDCHFLHPGDPNPMSEIVCKFDGSCTRVGCFYKHEKQTGPVTPTNGKPKEPLSQRQFSVSEDQVEHMVLGESADIIKPKTEPNNEPNPETKPETKSE